MGHTSHNIIGLLGGALLAAISLIGCQIDSDGDGYVFPLDCSPFDPEVHPGASERCDGIDNNCDGQVDEGVLQTFYQDADGDEYGAPDTAIDACTAPICYVEREGDCDDADAGIHPDAPETCNGIDDDCDGRIDQGVAVAYRDLDGDSFGAESMPICTAQPGYVASRGDCDEGDPSIYPGALDPEGDGVDQDCGGTNGPDPSVGLSGQSLASIQAAVDAAVPGEIVWVGPGIYYETDLRFGGKALTLVSTDGTDDTVIDARQLGRVMEFRSGEARTTVVRGFTLTGGRAAQGAGVFMFGASPTLRELLITGNGPGSTSSGEGAGLYLDSADPLVAACTIRSNGGVSAGAVWLTHSDAEFSACDISNNGSAFDVIALLLDASNPSLRSCRINDNVGSDDVYVVRLLNSDATFLNCDISGNSASGFGFGALSMDSSSPTLTRCNISGNLFEGGTGGISIQGSSPVFTRCVIAGNLVPLGSIGGVGAVDSTPVFRQCQVLDNGFGGFTFTRSNATLESCEIAGNFTGSNLSSRGGGIKATDSELALRNCFITGNRGENGGGGIALFTSSATLQSCILSANTTGGFQGGTFTGNGGGMYVSDSSASIWNSVIAANRAGPLTGGTLGQGGGIFLTGSSSSLEFLNDILAYNAPDNLVNDPSAPGAVSIAYSDLYEPGGTLALNGPGGSNLDVEPRFLTYTDGLPIDYHLAPSSALIDRGDPHVLDPDGSRSDIGAYGGPLADDWNLDRDCYPDYFWPGTIDEAPTGFDPAVYDANDLDPAVH